MKGPPTRQADTVPAADSSLSPRGGAKHRRMKETILAVLENAGSDGMTIDEISKEIGVLKVRVQSWFSGTGKRVPNLEKIDVGKWRLLKR